MSGPKNEKEEAARAHFVDARREAALARLRFITGRFAVVPGVPRAAIDAWLDEVIEAMPTRLLAFDWAEALQAEQQQVSAALAPAAVEAVGERGHRRVDQPLPVKLGDLVVVGGTQKARASR